jgi:hypothetical protein
MDVVRSQSGPDVNIFRHVPRVIVIDEIEMRDLGINREDRQNKPGTDGQIEVFARNGPIGLRFNLSL